MKKSGVLLPVTALPSEYGIGCFSKSAFAFVDWLKGAGQSFWQILPLCPTGFGDSPYQSFSTFAGNPYMISLKELINEGLLTKEECDNSDLSDVDGYINYEKQYLNRFPLLYKAYQRSRVNNNADYKQFISENTYWLDDYSMYMALKKHFNEKVWNEWCDDILKRRPDALKRYTAQLKEEIDFWKFVQFKFFAQWKKLKAYANKNGISIIGDMPIYVSFDSADVWSNPELFELDEKFNPRCVAGCPPDDFCPTGQLWGNPVYNWKNHRLTKYKWWIRRLKHAFKMYDVVRIDHFRGFDEFYSIKFPCFNAVGGKWEKGPGIELFNAVKKELGDKSFIAEDLGFITDSVKKLLIDCGFCGMKVLEFAFDADIETFNDNLPHNYASNTVAYTGTHDNQTISSWFKTIPESKKNRVRSYLCDKNTPDSKIHLPLISLVLKSASKLSVIPLQDWLGLLDTARINTPSTIGNNWRWRVDKNQLNEDIKNTIYDMTKKYGRL